MPSEYLDRLRSSNELFGDDFRLEGVFVQAGRLQTVISQPALKGTAPTVQEIYDAMEEMGFDLVRSGGSQFFHRSGDNVPVYGAREGNFLKTVDGVLPIDVIPVRPQGGLLRAIQEAFDAGS